MYIKGFSVKAGKFHLIWNTSSGSWRNELYYVAFLILTLLARLISIDNSYIDNIIPIYQIIKLYLNQSYERFIRFIICFNPDLSLLI